jgi:hypothetical protein
MPHRSRRAGPDGAVQAQTKIDTNGLADAGQDVSHDSLTAMSPRRVVWRTINTCAWAGVALGLFAKWRWGWESDLTLVAVFCMPVIFLLQRKAVRRRLLGEAEDAALDDRVDVSKTQ